MKIIATIALLLVLVAPTFTEEIPRAFDPSRLRADNAPTWLDIKLPLSHLQPGDTNSEGLQLDQWSIIHPSVVYFPDGFAGYRYWFVGTPFNQGPHYENPCLYVSNDNVNWSEVIVGDDTLHNPIFSCTDFGVSYLSDCELFVTPSNELWLFFRAKKKVSDTGPDTNFIFGAYTTNGIDWQGKNKATSPLSIVDTIIGPVTSSDCLSNHNDNLREAQGFDLMSPAVAVTPDGRYRMWTVEKSISLSGCTTFDTVVNNEPNVVTLWEADNPEGPWDTVQTCQWFTSSGTSRDIWHLSVLPYGDSEYFALATETNLNREGSPAWLHLAMSYNNGTTFVTRRLPLLEAARCNHWADEIIYRSCGVWFEHNTLAVLGIYYSGYGGRTDDTLDERPRWATGYTECYLEPICLYRGNVDGIISDAGAVNIADLTALVDYLFRCGSPPRCIEEGNVNGVYGYYGPIDIADLTYLTNYLFHNGPPPPSCEEGS